MGGLALGLGLWELGGWCFVHLETYDSLKIFKKWKVSEAMCTWSVRWQYINKDGTWSCVAITWPPVGDPSPISPLNSWLFFFHICYIYIIYIKGVNTFSKCLDGFGVGIIHLFKWPTLNARLDILIILTHSIFISIFLFYYLFIKKI